MLGFGSLVLSHFPGLQSMGRVAGLGVLSAVVWALVALPALGSLAMARRTACGPESKPPGRPGGL
ncbi:MAG: hypothetical protein DWQ36_11415 [Acidobacteria bacterium]|nr:MAG: hypothetical protein DWQ30_17335 [Acidobacteriota bacterium]REK07813.1 MAG: hypothetical protein DWQ36_11415 [Acidobacteriota bacterium]